MQEILPIQITQRAIGKHVQQIALELDVDDSTIYRYCANPENDPYTRFRAVHRAALKVNPAGADLYAEDFIAAHEALKHAGVIKGGTKEEAVADALNAIGEFNKGGPDFEAKANQAIRAIRFLIVQSKV